MISGTVEIYNMTIKNKTIAYLPADRKGGWGHQGCARFPEILQNFSERQIFWSLCSVVFHALTLKLSVQTSLSPKFSVSLSSVENSGKRATPYPMSSFFHFHAVFGKNLGK